MALIAALIGLLLGSFYNVVIYRLPRAESLWYPPSHCPSCDRRLSAVDLVPVLSWLALRGRCRHCGTRIHWRYPLVEATTTAVFATAWVFSGNLLTWCAWACFASLLLLLAAIDLEHLRLPDHLTLSGSAAALVFALLGATVSPLEAALGIAIGAGLVYAVVRLSRGKMGLGDAKLLALIGGFLGPFGAVGAFFWGCIAGSVVGIALMLLRRLDAKTPIPFGPYLAVGAVLAMLVNPWALR